LLAAEPPRPFREVQLSRFTLFASMTDW